MKAGLDTSVVLRLLVGEPADQAEVALRYFLNLLEEGHRALVTDLVVAEVYFALQYHYRAPKAEALDRLRQFLETKGVENMGVAVQVLATPRLDSAKPGFVDRIIHQQYLKNADWVVTFEKSTRKFPKSLVLETFHRPCK